MANNIFELFDLISKKEDEKRTEPISWLVVGLGNPGKDYIYTRHNAGFDVIDRLSSKYSVNVNKSAHQALCGECVISGKHVLMLKPQTFMNNSGISVREAASFYKIPVSNILVIYDDINLDIGRLRVRRKGSDGGHNGIKSIIYHLQSNEFPRVKVGVGQKPHPEYDLASWVLSDIPVVDRENFTRAADDAISCIELIISGDTEKAMQLYN